MLPSKHRLTRREDFTLIYKQGSYVGQGDLSLKHLKTNDQFTKIGFPVGKKYSKKATDRNQVRRLLREAIRTQLPLLKAGYHIVIMVRPEAKSLQFKQTVELTKKLFTKANLFS